MRAQRAKIKPETADLRQRGGRKDGRTEGWTDGRSPLCPTAYSPLGPLPKIYVIPNTRPNKQLGANGTGTWHLAQKRESGVKEGKRGERFWIWGLVHRSIGFEVAHVFSSAIYWVKYDKRVWGEIGRLNSSHEKCVFTFSLSLN